MLRGLGKATLRLRSLIVGIGDTSTHRLKGLPCIASVDMN